MLRAYNTVGLADSDSVGVLYSVVGKKFVTEDGETYEITDNPISRMVEAVRTVFPDPVEGGFATMRLYQLFLAIGEDGEALAPLVRKEDEDMFIHSSLVMAAATVPLQEDNTFEPGSLLVGASGYFARH